MRNKSLVVVSLVVGLGGFAAGRLLPSVPHSHDGAQAAGARKVLHYACPMHPGIKSDKPGTAPCCGMNLEPVYADGGPASLAETHPAGTVTIPTSLRQLQGVRVGAVEASASSQALRLFGKVVPDETRTFTLNAALEGYIYDLTGVTSGAVVHRDQRLGSFFAPDLRAPLQAYITALDVIDVDPAKRDNMGLMAVAGSSANRNAMYVVERLRSLGVSVAQLESMRHKREIPLAIDIRSPTDGVVMSRMVTTGQKFDKGMEWFRIANLDRVWVLADLNEADAGLARPGMKATVTIPGGGRALAAVVSQVPPTFDAASRVLKVRLEVENPGLQLRPDMYVDVALQVERPAAVTIPADALVDSGLRKTVFVEAGDGTYEPRAVETGWRFGDRVEVTRGLAAGERIVVSGTFLVDSESQLRAAAAPAPAAPEAAMAPAKAMAEALQPGTAIDPVCHMKVDEAKAKAAGRTATHQGKSHSFCSDDCKARFLAAPEKFTELAAPSRTPAHGQDDGHAHDRPLHASAGSAP